MAGKSKSRSGCSGVEGFSYFDRATREDVGLSDAPRPEPVSLELWAPLHPPLPARDARASGRTRRRRGNRLSLEHIDSNSPLSPPVPSPSQIKKPSRAVVWPDGSAAFIPGIQEFDRGPEREPPPRGPRGKVLSLSEQARRRIQRFLDTVRRDALCFSMCLTCPGRWSPEWNSQAKAHFLTLLKQMTGSRDEIISSTGVFWKQELQSREAVHFHLLFWGLSPEQTAHVQRWIGERWSALVCKGFHPRDASKHLAWHLHPTNMFPVRNMSRYFAKYLGKDEEASLLKHPIPGRWWGKINSAFIPVSVREETALTPAAAIYAQRVARKLRQVKANEGKHRAICRAAGLADDSGNPMVSSFYLTCSRHRGSSNRVSGSIYHEIAAFHGVRFGKASLPAYLRTASVTLSGPSAPATGARILSYALGRETEEFVGVPF
jgi:hypothetical protein